MAHLALTGDFPMPNRSDLMSLQTINARQDQAKVTTQKMTTLRNTSNNLTTNDIEGKSSTSSQLDLKRESEIITETARECFSGAGPKLHGSKQVNKPEFTNTNWDIDRSGPRALHIGLYKQETNLLTSDIQGAAPQIVKFQSKRQGNDPLNP